jgi:geranylgeranyl pyrophosphate synthase/predicted secreted hydrolase
VPEPGRTSPAPAAPHGTPHPSAGLEWWYLNGHLRADDGREHHWRVLIVRHEALHHRDTEPGYGCAVVCTGDAGTVSGTWVTPGWHQMLRDMFDGDRAVDPRVRQAMQEVLAEGVPLPDRLLDSPVRSCDTALDISLTGLVALRADEDGSYSLSFRGEGHPHLELLLLPRKPSSPQCNERGHVTGRFSDGADALTTRLIPRLDALGTVTTVQGEQVTMQGQAWFEHTWGGAWSRSERRAGVGDRCWEWAGVQLDNGWDVSAGYYSVRDAGTGARHSEARPVTVSAPDGSVRHCEMVWRPLREWTSAATLDTFPTAVRLQIPEFDFDLEVTAPPAGHEIRTILNGRGWWESPATVTGTMGGVPVQGQAFLQTFPGSTVADIEQYTRRAYTIAREEAAAVYPTRPGDDLSALTGTEDGPALDEATRRRLHDLLVQPVHHLLDVPGRAWRPYAALAVLCLFGIDPEPYRPLTAAPELLHTASMIIDDIQDDSLLRRGRAPVHKLIGTSAAITTGTTAYFAFGPVLERIPQSDPATMLRVHRIFLRALRAGHAGQALDLAGHRETFDHAVATGDNHRLLEQIRTAHRLKTGVPVRCIAEAAAVLAGATEAQIQAVGHYFEAVGTAYQISDDVADLDGVSTAEDRRQDRTPKVPAEDLRNGEVTYPVAHAITLLNPTDRGRLRDALYLQTPAGAARAAALITHSGALTACLAETHEMIDQAWTILGPLLPPTQHKAMINALGWYAAQRIPDQASPAPEQHAR